MIFARPVSEGSNARLELALARMGVPAERLRTEAEDRSPWSLLLTGLSDPDRSFLAASSSGVSWLPGPRSSTGLLSGAGSQIATISSSAHRQGLSELSKALQAALAVSEPPAPLSLGPSSLRFGERTHLMAVVNVTPDSFSDGGSYFSTEAAVARGVELAEAGAQILDVGGESTRPGAPSVSVAEELDRVVPVVRALHERLSGVPISVDTTKAEVARAALEAGASMINEISALRFDPRMGEVIARSKAAVCLMHMQGTPQTMQTAPRYGDLVEEVLTFLAQAVERAVAAGISRDRIVLDPGIGFGKTFGHNLWLLRNLSAFRLLGLPVLVGTSRKAFLGKVTGGKGPTERLAATLGSISAVAAAGSADLVRVHDLTEAKDALAVADAIRQSTEAGDLFGPLGATEGV